LWGVKPLSRLALTRRLGEAIMLRCTREKHGATLDFLFQLFGAL
jgi:hypothetical protein